MIQSHGDWAAVKQMPKAKMFEKSDERIPGDSDFVGQVLWAAEEQLEKPSEKLVGYSDGF